MSIELASVKAIAKPWGSTNLRPWSDAGQEGSRIGELWFGRSDPSAPEPALLLKLLFTEQPLSIQVHPDDAYARSIGLPHGKTEAWYVVAASPEAKIALGLKQIVTAPELRTAIDDGSLPDLVHWQHVQAAEAILVPAGTIHAIGAGLVIAEIQQRSDATFRMFDYERHRQLHVEDAIGAALAGPVAPPSAPKRLSPERRLLASSRYFVLERIDLARNSRWELDAKGEAWMLSLSGAATFNVLHASPGDAVFIESQSVGVRAGPDGFGGLIAYVAIEPAVDLLREFDDAKQIVAKSIPETQEVLT